MKNYGLRNVFALLLALTLMFALSATALAADSTVTFDEGRVIVFAPGSEYTSSDLFDEFKGVMPGDTLTETITIENKNTEFDYLKVYLCALAHNASNQPQADVSAELSNDFLSKLSMKVWNGSSLIYSDSPDKPGGLANSVYLGQIASEQAIELKVELSVPIDLNNEYAKRIGEVDWEFTFEGFDVDVLTVCKIWTGDTTDHPDSVQVQLYKDSEVYDTQTLSPSNHWTYTWADLDNDYTWDVKEVEMDGYTTTYTKEGNDILITNYKPGPTPPPLEDYDLTVVKRWDNGDKPHPDSVTITLYDGNRIADRVTLSNANNWTYTWENLNGEGQWRVMETNIDGGYVPSYTTQDHVVTVTNSYKLIQTGQLFWPIPVLSSLGVLFIAYGIYSMMKMKKRKNNCA